MRVTLSAAVTADGFLDDNSPRRLIISTPEDWAEVYRLRAAHDAILVGAETLRRDDPSLLVRDEEVRARRRERGLPPDIAKVTLTGTGELSPGLRFFTEGEAERYVFSPYKIDSLQRIATVISTGEPITAKLIVTQLEKRGVERLMVEGGATVLRMFLGEGMADTLRLAVNPQLRLGSAGGAEFRFTPPQGTPQTRENLGGMEVTTYTLHPDTSAADLRFLKQAVDEGRKCTPSATSYCVGAVVVTADGRNLCRAHARNLADAPRRAGSHRQGAGGRSGAPRSRHVLLDGTLLATSQRTGELHAAPAEIRIRPRRLRALRTRLLRLLPRCAHPARSGRRRTGLSRTGRGSVGSQRPPEALKPAQFMSIRA